MSAELKICVTRFIYLWDFLQVRYNHATFNQCRICVTDFREDFFCQLVVSNLPPSPQTNKQTNTHTQTLRHIPEQPQKLLSLMVITLTWVFFQGVFFGRIIPRSKTCEDYSRNLYIGMQVHTDMYFQKIYVLVPGPT